MLYVVQDLVQGCGITCDDFLTLLELTTELDKQKVFLGTMRHIRR